MSIIQMILILAVMLFSLIVGIVISNNTREEHSKGKKWFWTLIVLSILGVFFSSFYFEGDELVFYLASFACVLIISMVPLAMKGKKKSKRS